MTLENTQDDTQAEETVPEAPAEEEESEDEQDEEEAVEEETEEACTDSDADGTCDEDNGETSDFITGNVVSITGYQTATQPASTGIYYCRSDGTFQKDTIGQTPPGPGGPGRRRPGSTRPGRLQRMARGKRSRPNQATGRRPPARRRSAPSPRGAGAGP